MWNNLGPEIRRAVKFSILGCAPIIFMSFFRWYIEKYFTWLIGGPLEAFAFLLLAVTLIITFINMISMFKKYGKQLVYPFLIPFFIFLTMSYPYRIAEYINFQRYYKERAEVVRLIKSGKIKDNRTNFRLPAKYKDLSFDGKIFFTKEGNKTGIFFYFLRNPSVFDGTLYIDETNWSATNPYKIHTIELDYHSKIKVKDNWYIVSSD